MYFGEKSCARWQIVKQEDIEVVAAGKIEYVQHVVIAYCWLWRFVFSSEEVGHAAWASWK